jgi:hypothetical protein
VTGPIPLYGEGGVYRPPAAHDAIHLWLDADKTKWVALVAAGARPKKHPGPGVRYLGNTSLADPNLCTFRFEFEIPDVEPGPHEVVAITFGGGAALYGEAILRIDG